MEGVSAGTGGEASAAQGTSGVSEAAFAGSQSNQGESCKDSEYQRAEDSGYGLNSGDSAESGQEEQPENGETADGSASWQYEFKMPEGMRVCDESMSRIVPLFRELNIPPDKAQQLIDIHFREHARMMSEQFAMQRETVDGWIREIRGDPEIGGRALAENLSYANALLREYSTPELRSMLRETGLDKHPDLVRFLIKAGRAASEDHFVDASRKGSGSPRTLEELGRSVFSNSLG